MARYHLILAWIWAYLNHLDNETKLSTNKFTSGSRVVCNSRFGSNRCYFHNLCYIQKQFVMVHGPGTSIQGVPLKPRAFGIVNASGVPNHSEMYFDYADLNWITFWAHFSAPLFLHGTTIILKRFLPNNLMHVIHDDLLPLYMLLKEENLLHTTDFSIFYSDSHESDVFKTLYSIPAPNATSYSTDAFPEVVCFERAIVGLSTNSLWYQYGFTQPQGALSSRITTRDLRDFIQWLRNGLNLQPKPISKRTAILLSRKRNRLIMNEFELVFALNREFKLKTKLVALETHEYSEIFQEVMQTNLLVSMHGSLLTSMLFLPPGAIVVELFPYAVNPLNYTPYKTLARLLGQKYLSWQNAWKNATVEYPGNPPELGGIHHLSLQDQKQIMQSESVREHLCCGDPQWLFRIYQDTHVNVNEITGLLKKVL